MNTLKAKAGKCKVCKQPIVNAVSTLATACSLACAMELVNRDKARKLKKVAADERKKHLSDKARIKPLSKWLQEAQIEFNKYIRLRDANKPCISCGCTTAVQWHAGHYRTTKSASHLRFNEDNCHKQCSQDNLYHSGRISDYRIRLIERIGLVRVCLLENDSSTKRWSVEELKEIKSHYSKLCRELSK